MLDVKGISGGYGGRKIIDGLSFSVEKGELFGILGPNGSGKTTLLKMLTRTHPLDDGQILLNGKDLRSYRSKHLARLAAVLPQFVGQSFSYSVCEVVKMGRYPYQSGIFNQADSHDREHVETAMKQTGVAAFADHDMNTLSGGEKQRVYLAQALAQQPELLLLDEPTNHLDIHHQKQLLDGLKKWAKQDRLTVIAIFHDLNLAALYCDRVLLLNEGKKAALDSPKEVLNEGTIHEVYGTDVTRTFHPSMPSPVLSVSPQK
ncbi:MAG TPA: heme ABC transporter ATP-binding protein [Bacillales bacterium]|nr:heme ABC transporter ATP-binding protein [Bacillales bacterium]